MSQEKQIALLFICLGNICRSPAAEGIMKQLVERKGLSHRFFIDSAGIGRWHIGQLPDSRMRKHGARRGYQFDSRARVFTASDFDAFDLIIGMDDENYEDIIYKARNEADKAKVHRMTEYLQKYKQYRSVPDPYYEGPEGFELVLDLLEDGCAGLLNACLHQK